MRGSGVRTGVAALACAVLTACAAETAVSDFGGDCVSHYDSLARAASWKDLRDRMVASEEWGAVASVRTQSRGGDQGAGDKDVVRVVDLLDRKGRRMIQADVWRTDAGGWRAGVWSQCID